MTSTSASSTVATDLSSSPEVDLQDWLERFAERLKGRTNAVADEVRQLVDHVDVVELSLKNTFNSFRGLSSSQFIENRVYDEDETEVISSWVSRDDAKSSSVPSERYEEDILPRYKDAVAIAWRAFQKSGRRPDKSFTRRSNLGNLRGGERRQILPHIIGTEDFARDVYCGLSDLRRRPDDSSQRPDDSEFEIEVDRDEATLAGEGSGHRSPSEADMSGRESDASDYQDGGFEPAVSAAMDFKAQLEAALRNPSLPYDGGTLQVSENAFENFGDSGYTLPSLADDALSDDAPRTISTLVDIIGKTMSTLGENKNELPASTYETSNSVVNIAQWPAAGLPSELLVQPSGRENTSSSRSSSQPDEDQAMGSETRQEQVKQPFYSQTQSMLNEEFMQKFLNRDFSRPGESGKLAYVRKVSGLLDDEDNERGVLTEKRGLAHSSTGPTIPEGLLPQRLQSVDFPNEPRAESSASKMAQILLSNEPLHVYDAKRVVTSDENSSHTFEDTDRAGPNESEPDALSPGTHISTSVSASSDMASWPKGIPQQIDTSPFRGGLFDDDDEEEEEDNSRFLFGASGPQKVESQPILRPWASESSKGLFDDIMDVGVEDDVAPRLFHEEGPTHNSKTPSVSHDAMPGPVEAERRPVESGSSEPSLRPSSKFDLMKPIQAEGIESDRNTGSTTILETPARSLLAAALQSSRPAATGSDEDLWSSSDSEVGNATDGNGKQTDQSDPDTTSENPEDDGSGTKDVQSPSGESIFNAKKRAIQVESDQTNQNLSWMVRSAIAVHSGQGEESDSLSPTAASPRVPTQSMKQLNLSPSQSMSRSNASKGPSSTEMESNPTLQPAGLDRPNSDGSGSEDANGSPWLSEHDDVSQPLHRTLSSDAMGLYETMGPSVSQPSRHSDRTNTSTAAEAINSSHPVGQRTNFARKTTSFTGADASISMSEDAPQITKRITSEPVNEFGRLTGGRTFASLFEDDEAEDRLFGGGPKQYQGKISSPTRQRETGLPYASTKRSLERDKSVKNIPPLTIPDTALQSPGASRPPPDLSSGSTLSDHVVEKDSILPSAKAGSRFSLLFGDEDDVDNEDALFGPLGGSRAATGSGSGMTFRRSASLFDDPVDNLSSNPSRPAPRSRALFDD